MDCQTLTKIVFLVFVVILTIYVVFFNKYSKEDFQEEASVSTAPTAPETSTPPTAPSTTSMSFTGQAVSTEAPTTASTGFVGEARLNAPETEKLPIESEFKSPSECLFKQYSQDGQPRLEQSKLFNKTENNDTVPQDPLPEPVPTLRQQIINVYNDLFKQNPSEEEIMFYVQFFRKRQDDLDYMRETISTSAPSLKKTLRVGKSSYMAPETNEGTEDEVIAIYEQILQRHPNNQELAHFSIYVKQDPVANMEKLKVLLVQSEEYKRLKSLQSNVPYGHLLSGVTDRQITLMVTSIYNDITKNGDKLDEDTLKFLKKKYLEFQLDEQTFRKFIEDFVLYKPTNTTFNKSMDPTSQEPQEDGFAHFNSPHHLLRANNTVVSNIAKEAFENSDVQYQMQDAPQPVEAQQPDQQTSQPSPASAFVGDNAPGSCLNSDALMNRIKKSECSFDKNYLENRYKSNSETLFADTVHQRNRDELKNICQRNKKYERFHCDDMVLLPGQEWTVPQRHPPVCVGDNSSFNPMVDQTSLIGTLLSDVKTSGNTYQCTQHHNVMKS